MEVINSPSLEEVSLTDFASEKLTGFLTGKDDPEACLRLGVVGGGCVGFQYRLALDYKRDDDLIFESKGHTIVIDPQSYPYVAGAEIDFKDDLIESGFDVKNPNSVGSCGCGSSFRVEEDTSCGSTIE